MSNPKVVKAQVEFLRKAFAKFETMTENEYDRLIAILDRADDQALLATSKAKIKFVSALAYNRCISRGLVKISVTI